MTGEDKGFDFSSPIEVVWRMFTLITCTLVILSGILRQAKGELKSLWHSYSTESCCMVRQALPRAPVSDVLNYFSGFIYCLHISDKKAYLVCLFKMITRHQLFEIHNRSHSFVFKWFMMYFMSCLILLFAFYYKNNVKLQGI